MGNNAFGKLVRTSREQRQWKQSELAERWGFTREYVSQIECGKRKLDRSEQVARLAEILGITQEQLTNAGKERTPQRPSPAQSAESKDILLQALLEPALSYVKLSWLIWQDDRMPTDLTYSLHNLEQQLKDALGLYHGQFYPSAMHVLISVHEMLGRLAVERTATQEAITHFQEMYDIAEELGDTDLLTLAMIHQAAMFRRKRRFEASFRRLEAAEKGARVAAPWLQGLLAKTYARTYYVYGDEQAFLRSIDKAASIAEDTEPTIDTIPNSIDKIGVLVERAQGYTLFWQPEKALTIYEETDKLCPTRPLRAQCASHIAKAQAYCYSGNLETGIEHALTGLRLTEKLQISRYVLRLQQMSDRLSVTPIGKERTILDLRSEILNTWDKLSPRE